MLTALFSRIGSYITGLVLKYVVDLFNDYVLVPFVRAYKARQRRREQEKKDEASKVPYDNAIQTGDDHAIEDATEDRLNG